MEKDEGVEARRLSKRRSGYCVWNELSSKVRTTLKEEG